MIEYANQLRNEKYNVRETRSYSKKKGTVRHYYCNDIFTFDIETTSAWIDENNHIITYKKGLDSEYWNGLTPLALCYIWQFSFNEQVYYGRELKDFIKVLDDLPKNKNIVIWVHNLSFEFQFLCNILTWKTVFARSPHKPMKCVSNEYPNIEFRCSYMLTRLSLESWGKQIGFHKDVGYLDYEKMRTPLTKLTKKEMQYAEDDCLVVYHGIQKYLKEYKEIRNIPLTQTGTVRQVVKERLMKDREYSKHIKKLVPYSLEEYQRLMDVFAGGYTHANKIYAGYVQREYIEHYDFASSYPSVMVCEKYPDTVWLWTRSKEIPSDYEMEKNAYILKLSFTNITSTTFNTYIQASKCIGDEMNLDNGRVVSARKLQITITEQDYLTIRETYKWDKCEIVDMWYAEKRYLPKELIEYILELYENKTKLKDIDEYEDIYMQSKQYINSLFGMAVTGIVQPDVIYEDGLWKVEPITQDKAEKRFDKLRVNMKREKRYFMSYSWGCWITAYARRNLWKCLIPNDYNVLYCDTDSIFIKGKGDFEWYNEDINRKMKEVCDYYGIPFEKTRPKTSKGKEKPLGIFAKEDDCCEFVSLGAKRYVERRINDKKLHLTVSGINKEAVALLNNDIENFKDGFNFDKDADCVRKQLAVYLIDMPMVKYPDGYISNYRFGINLRRTGYLLEVSDEYSELIDMLHSDFNSLGSEAVRKFYTGYIS